MKNTQLRLAIFAGVIALVAAGGAWAEKSIVGSISTKNILIKDFPKLAKISSGQAVKAATDSVPGDVISVGLESEDHSLVYAVEVVNATSGLNEINVDAGDGKILSQHRKDKNHREEKDDDDEQDED